MTWYKTCILSPLLHRWIRKQCHLNKFMAADGLMPGEALVALRGRSSRNIIAVQSCHMAGSCANMLVDHKLYVESGGPPRSCQRRHNCSYRPAGKTGRLPELCKIHVWCVHQRLGCCVCSLFRLLLGALRKYIVEDEHICFCQVELPLPPVERLVDGGKRGARNRPLGWWIQHGVHIFHSFHLFLHRSISPPLLA